MWVQTSNFECNLVNRGCVFAKWASSWTLHHSLEFSIICNKTKVSIVARQSGTEGENEEMRTNLFRAVLSISRVINATNWRYWNTMNDMNIYANKQTHSCQSIFVYACCCWTWCFVVDSILDILFYQSNDSQNDDEKS